MDIRYVVARNARARVKHFSIWVYDDIFKRKGWLAPICGARAYWRPAGPEHLDFPTCRFCGSMVRAMTTAYNREVKDGKRSSDERGDDVAS